MIGVFMETNGSRPRWQEILDQSLTDLRNKYKNMSEAQIAQKIGLHRATLNRFYNEKSKPHFSNLVKILVGAGNDSMIQDALDSYDASIANVFDVSLSNENNKLVTHEFEEILDDRNVFVAYNLSALDKGTNKEQLINVLGSAGIEALNTLLKNDLVEERNGSYFKSSKYNMVRSFDSAKHHLNTYSYFYKVEHVEKKRNYMHSMSEGLNSKGILAARIAHKKFQDEMIRIMDDKSNHGDVPFFSVGFCDSFTNIDSEILTQEKLQ